MSNFSEMCDVVKGYCTGKRFREKVFKYKKYPKSKNECFKYCIYIYQRFVKFVDKYHKELYNKLNGDEKARLREEVFFPLAIEKFNETYDLLKDRFKRWYDKHPYKKVKKNGRKHYKNENPKQV